MVWLSLTDNGPAERWLRTRLEQHMSTGGSYGSLA